MSFRKDFIIIFLREKIRFKRNYLKRQGEKRKSKAGLAEENLPRKCLGFSKYFSFSLG
jgi:hypothetical protein